MKTGVINHYLKCFQGKFILYSVRDLLNNMEFLKCKIYLRLYIKNKKPKKLVFILLANISQWRQLSHFTSFIWSCSDFVCVWKTFVLQIIQKGKSPGTHFAT
jgi:hypothetical protein